MTRRATTLTGMIGLWLNLDAELELAEPRGYRQSARVAERIAALRPRLAHLLGTHGRVIGEDDLAPGSPAFAWCPTPSALAAIDEHRLLAVTPPSFEVVRRVNHRSFSASLGQTLDGASEVHDMQALERSIRGSSPTGDWVLKRPFGFAGRERRRAIGGVLDESTYGFARASFDRGDPLQVEPWVERTLDVSIHGWVHERGQVVLARPVVQRCDAMGRFLSTIEGALGSVPAGLSRELRLEAKRVGSALLDAGYFGPFGIDGFEYRDARGRLRFNPRCEINARFTMGFRWPPGVDLSAVANSTKTP